MASLIEDLSAFSMKASTKQKMQSNFLNRTLLCKLLSDLRVLDGFLSKLMAEKNMLQEAKYQLPEYFSEYCLNHLLLITP